VADEPAWRALFEQPLSLTLEQSFDSDLVRGIVLTDGLIGTFARADEPSLRQNRCLLYHVIGNGTGDWDVPVGGMGAITASLADVAAAGGAELVCGAEVLAADPAGEVRYRRGDAEHRVHGDHLLANISPDTLAGLLGEPVDELLGELAGDRPEGAQLKVNMVLSRLPRLRDTSVDPKAAFAGTFHVNEGYRQLADAYAEAAAGRIPALPPCEIYCHSLTDPSIVGAGERAAGAQTLTLFGLHLPARLFAGRNDAARAEALAATLASLDSALAEPIEDCLLRDANGKPCVEAKTRSTWSASSACRPGTSSTGTCPGPTPPTPSGSVAGGWRPGTTACCSAALAPRAAAGSAASGAQRRDGGTRPLSARRRRT